MRIAIHFFSGCGNTQWVAYQARKQLTGAGHEIVLMQNVQEAFPTQMPQSDVDLFLAPVYFGSLPANMIKYFKRLPMVAGRKAIFWSVCGAKKGAANWMARALLLDRGYDIIDTESVVMPDTFLFLALSQKNPEQRKEILEKAQQKIAQNLEVLVSLPTRKKDNPILLFFSFICSFLYLVCIRHALGMMMVASSKCIHCGACADNCPAHCIQMKDGKPTWHTGCVNCFGCLNQCPAQAIDFSKYALFFGIAGALIGALLIGAVIKIGLISKIFGFFAGFFCGCFIYTKCTKFFDCDKGLLLKNKQRVVITKQEKDL